MPLDQLTRAAQLRVLRQAAVTALAGYDLRPDRIRLIRYEDNAVYLVVAGDHRYMLRISLRDGRSASEQRSEIFWLSALVAEGAVLVPAPVARPGGEYVSEVGLAGGAGETATAVVFEWIPGRANPPYDGPDIAERMGAVTASLHENSRALRFPDSWRRPSWGVADLFSYGPALSEKTARSRLGPARVAIIRATGDRLSPRITPEADEWGLIHADLYRENMVVTGDGELGVIDFDDCGSGHYMLDIATVLSSVYRACGNDRNWYRRFADSYLSGYGQVRALPRSLNQLEEFLIMRDMIIVNFVTHSRNPTVATWGPDRVAGIVNQMRASLDGEPYPGSL